MERRELRRLLGVQPTGRCEPALVREAQPEDFLRALAGAVAGDGEVFVGNPLWTESELARASAQIPTVRPDGPVRDRGWLMIPTGGTSGGLRFARHDGFTLAAAAQGFSRHFALPQVNAVGVLPLFHVSGFMAWMRCVTTGGEYRAWDWKRLENGDWPELAADRPWVVSLVPTQLDRLLRRGAAVEKLRGFRAVFLGGAPAWPDLLDRAAAARLPLSLSYGMTETAAMVTALRPEEFLAGDRSAGPALPHARVELDAEGVVQIGASSLFRGYYPDWRHERKFFATADLGEFDARRHLRVLGRRDAAIVTGGEKVHPAEVEAVVRGATGATEFAVVGLPDPEWGEKVVVVFARGSAFDAVRAAAAVRSLSAPQRPKHFLALPVWPRNEAGKLNRARLVELAQAELRAGAGRGAE